MWCAVCCAAFVCKYCLFPRHQKKVGSDENGDTGTRARVWSKVFVTNIIGPPPLGRYAHTVLSQQQKWHQVSEVTPGEVKGAIVHINSLFTISMVKSRLTQRLTRARKNIARRRRQATTGEKYGPSLSDTEQVGVPYFVPYTI